jgi:NADH:ubiquinone oxidoreductase subunit H
MYKYITYFCRAGAARRHHINRSSACQKKLHFNLPPENMSYFVGFCMEYSIFCFILTMGLKVENLIESKYQFEAILPDGWKMVSKN